MTIHVKKRKYRSITNQNMYKSTRNTSWGRWQYPNLMIPPEVFLCFLKLELSKLDKAGLL